MKKQKDFTKSATDFFISGSGSEKPIQDENEIEIPRGYKLVKETKSERMQLLVTPTVKEEIKIIAVKDGVSMNDLANRIFEEYLKKRGEKE